MSKLIHRMGVPIASLALGLGFLLIGCQAKLDIKSKPIDPGEPTTATAFHAHSTLLYGHSTQLYEHSDSRVTLWTVKAYDHGEQIGQWTAKDDADTPVQFEGSTIHFTTTDNKPIYLTGVSIVVELQ